MLRSLENFQVITVDGNRISVAVGEVDHPITEEHFIQWIYLETEKGEQRKILNPNDVPKAVFTIEDNISFYKLHNIVKIVRSHSYFLYISFKIASSTFTTMLLPVCL